ncbi:O-antigen polymerase [Bacillus smithii]|uniref:O-antigen polymerase n=1 Tax=Bacillus smithii TaxID=1479 RepID=UPI0030C9CD6F
MNTLILTITIMLVTLLAIVVENKKLTPLVINIISMLPITVGYYLLGIDQKNQAVWILCLFSTISFLLGYSFFKLVVKRKDNYQVVQENIKDFNFNPLNYLHHQLFISVIIIMVIYHFLVGGVPILSSDVETKRFSFSSSGLFGIPGRFYLFGIPYMLIYSMYYVKQVNNKAAYKMIIVAWIFFIVFKMLSGFKGVLVDITIFFAFSRACIGKPIRLMKILSFKSLLLIFGAFVFAGLISRLYPSLRLQNTNDVIIYLLARLTELPAQPGFYVLTHLNEFEQSRGFYFLGEISYFFDKYFHIKLLKDLETYPIDKIVSSIIYKTPLSDDNFIAPVTVGAFPGLVLYFGITFAYFIMYWIGFFYAWIYYSALQANDPFKGAVLGLTLYEINIYITNGGLIYLIINLTVMFIILYLLKILCSLLARLIYGSIRKSYI